jgi:hypothetical protein
MNSYRVRGVPTWWIPGIAVWCFVLSAASAASATTLTGEKPASPSAASVAADQVWMVSSRCADACPPVVGNATGLNYWLQGPDHQWQSRTADEFLAAQTNDLPTVYYVHGNRVDSQQAVSDAWMALGAVKATAAGKPLRLVIWSWPADRIDGRNRPDVQTKATRSDAQSYYLAWCLSRLDPQARVCLAGYSFGARVITGALHILAGGEIAGQSLDKPVARSVPFRAVLVAAALDNDWLMPGHRDGLAMSQVDKMLVTINGQDPALKYYPMMYGRGGPEALGFTGPAGVSCMGADGQKLELIRVDCQVGKVHDWRTYSAAASLVGRLGYYARLTDEP